MVHTETAPGPDDAYQVGGERRVHQALEGCSAMGEQAQIQALVGYVHQPEAEGKGLLSDDAPWWSHDVVNPCLHPGGMEYGQRGCLKLQGRSAQGEENLTA